MGNVVNEVHLVVGIDAGKLYPVTAEDMIIGKIGAKVQGDPKKQG